MLTDTDLVIRCLNLGVEGRFKPLKRLRSGPHAVPAARSKNPDGLKIPDHSLRFVRLYYGASARGRGKSPQFTESKDAPPICCGPRNGRLPNARVTMPPDTTLRRGMLANGEDFSKLHPRFASIRRPNAKVFAE